MRALSIAATGMLAQQTNVEVIANNLANMNTTGFKEQRAEFEDLLYQNVEQPGTQSSDTGTIVPSGIQLGAGVRTADVYRITGQGDLSDDIAILTTSRSTGPAISASSSPTARMPIPAPAISRCRRKASLSPNRAMSCSPASPFRPTATASRSTPRAR